MRLSGGLPSLRRGRAGRPPWRLPAGRQRATVAAWRLGEAVAGRASVDLTLSLGARVAETVLTVAPGRFDGLRANLRRVVPDATDAELERLVRANARNLGRAWAEVVAMQDHGDELVQRVHPVDVENMLGPLERGRGAVNVSLHLGSWETGIACWNRRFGQMTLLAEVLQPPELFERIMAGRRRLGVEVIPVDTSGMRESHSVAAGRRLRAAALRDVVRTLRAGRMVAIAMDRDVIGNGVPLDFFGAPAPIPLGVVEVAIRMGAAIVPIFLIRAGREIIAPCLPEIVYDPAAPREAEVRRVGAELLRAFEQVIREHPDQWHVLEPIWPQAGGARADAGARGRGRPDEEAA